MYLNASSSCRLLSEAFLRHKLEILIFLVGSVTSLTFFCLAFVWGTNPTLPIITGGEDVEEYLFLAQHLLEGRGYTLSQELPYVPESFRMPGYPLFIAPFIAVFGSPIAVAIIQTLLFGGIVLLTFLIARSWFGTRTAYMASFLSTLNVSLLYHTAILASETLFIFLFLLSLYLWLKIHTEQSYNLRLAFLAGFLLGFATLTRVIGFLLPVTFLLLSLVHALSRRPYMTGMGKRLAMMWLISITGFILVVSPWLVRNYLAYEQVSLSSTSTINMWYFNIPQVMADMRGMTVEEARQIFIPPDLVEGMIGENKYDFPLRQLNATPILKEEISAYLQENLSEYIKGHLLRSAGLLFVDSTRDTALLFGIPMTGHNILPSKMTPLARSGDLGGLVKQVSLYVKSGDWENILALSSFTFWFLLMTCVFLGSVFALKFLPRDVSWVGVTCCVGMIFYFAILAGPVTFPRTRLPLEPFAFILGSYGLVGVYTILASRMRRFS